MQSEHSEFFTAYLNLAFSLYFNLVTATWHPVAKGDELKRWGGGGEGEKGRGKDRDCERERRMFRDTETERER